MKRIKYIGIKPFKRDNVAGTGLIWTPGQIHAVDDGKAPFLISHPTVWVDADQMPDIPLSRLVEPIVDPILPTPKSAQTEVPARISTSEIRQTLIVEAEALGLKVDRRWSNDSLEKQIEEIRSAE